MEGTFFEGQPAEGDIFEVESIIDYDVGENGKKYFRVRWNGYGPDDDTWEPYSNLLTCDNLVKDFMRNHKKKKKKKRKKEEKEQARLKLAAQEAASSDNSKESSASAIGQQTNVDANKLTVGNIKLMDPGQLQNIDLDDVLGDASGLTRQSRKELQRIIAESKLAVSAEARVKKPTEDVSSVGNTEEQSLPIRDDGSEVHESLAVDVRSSQVISAKEATKDLSAVQVKPESGDDLSDPSSTVVQGRHKSSGRKRPLIVDSSSESEPDEETKELLIKWGERRYSADGICSPVRRDVNMGRRSKVKSLERVHSDGGKTELLQDIKNETDNNVDSTETVTLIPSADNDIASNKTTVVSTSATASTVTPRPSTPIVEAIRKSMDTGGLRQSFSALRQNLNLSALGSGIKLKSVDSTTRSKNVASADAVLKDRSVSTTTDSPPALIRDPSLSARKGVIPHNRRMSESHDQAVSAQEVTSVEKAPTMTDPTSQESLHSPGYMAVSPVLADKARKTVTTTSEVITNSHDSTLSDALPNTSTSSEVKSVVVTPLESNATPLISQTPQNDAKPVERSKDSVVENAKGPIFDSRRSVGNMTSTNYIQAQGQKSAPLSGGTCVRDNLVLIPLGRASSNRSVNVSMSEIRKRLSEHGILKDSQGKASTAFSKANVVQTDSRHHRPSPNQVVATEKQNGPPRPPTIHSNPMETVKVVPEPTTGKPERVVTPHGSEKTKNTSSLETPETRKEIRSNKELLDTNVGLRTNEDKEAMQMDTGSATCQTSSSSEQPDSMPSLTTVRGPNRPMQDLAVLKAGSSNSNLVGIPQSNSDQITPDILRPDLRTNKIMPQDSVLLTTPYPVTRSNQPISISKEPIANPVHLSSPFHSSHPSVSQSISNTKPTLNQSPSPTHELAASTLPLPVNTGANTSTSQPPPFNRQHSNGSKSARDPRKINTNVVKHSERGQLRSDAVEHAQIKRGQAREAAKVAGSLEDLPQSISFGDSGIHLEVTRVDPVVKEPAPAKLDPGTHRLPPNKARLLKGTRMIKKPSAVEFEPPKQDILGELLGPDEKRENTDQNNEENKNANTNKSDIEKQNLNLLDVGEVESEEELDLDMDCLDLEEEGLLGNQQRIYHDFADKLRVVQPIKLTKDELRAAVKSNRVDRVLGALAANCNPDVIDTESDFNLVMLAINYGHKDIARALLWGGADPNYQTQDGTTALMTAVEKGDRSLISSLVMNGAHIENQKPNGESALTIACRQGFPDVVVLLLNYGADAKLLAPQPAMSSTVQQHSVKAIIEKHNERLRELMEHFLAQFIMEFASVVKPAVLPCRCLSPRDNKEQELYFEFNRNPCDPGISIVFLCLPAEFHQDGSIRIKVAEVDNGVKSVSLNGKKQCQVIPGDCSLYILFPNYGQVNHLCFRTVESKYKLLVAVYAIQLKNELLRSMGLSGKY